MPRRRDPQQERVYQWENDWVQWNKSTETLTSLRAVIRAACRMYGLKVPPVVKQHDGGKYAWSLSGVKGKRDVISIQAKSQKNVATALHEAAHIIADSIFKDTVQDHGPEFLGVYMTLLERTHVAPREALHATARKYRLKWRDDVTPEIIRKAR